MGKIHVAEIIFNHLKQNKEKAYCDDCLCELLKIGKRQGVNARTEAFGLCQEFTKETAPCCTCKKSKLVTTAI